MKSKFRTMPYSKELQNIFANKFDCGNSAINAFLKSYDALDSLFGRTYVLLSDNECIVGYYNISTGDIADEKNIRIGGSVYLNYFAVDEKYQKVKYDEYGYISDFLLGDCINRVMEIQENYVGFSFITLSSTEEGYKLYERNGFYELEDDMIMAKNTGEKTCYPMYLPLEVED